MAGYGYEDAAHPDAAFYDAKGAALSVGVTAAFAVLVLYGLKKSGFRAMVAVGRG